MVNIQPLSLAQYEQCKTRAVSIIQRQIGDEPEKQSYLKANNPITFRGILLTSLLILVFIGALIPSSLHIVTHMTNQLSNVDIRYGLSISNSFYYYAHQLGYILLAESSLLIFTITHALKEDKPSILGVRLSLNLFLAIFAACFILYANLNAGIGFFESILPPIFTIGGGLIIESIITERAKNNGRAYQDWLNAYQDWDYYRKNPEKHDNYERIFNQAIWNSLVALPKNSSEELNNLSAQEKRNLVMQERSRDLWSDFNAEQIVIQKPEVLKLPTPKKEKKRTKLSIVKDYLKENEKSLGKSNEDLLKEIVENTELESVSLPTLIKAKKSF